MKKDVEMVKKNIEEKIKKNELAKKREKEIMARKFSYFKEKKNIEEIEEDNTKLFYDENVLKKSFLKKDQIIQDFKVTDNKKKLPKIVIPKDFKSNFLRDNIIKPVGKMKSNLIEFKENKIKDKNRALRRLENFKIDTNRKINRGF